MGFSDGSMFGCALRWTSGCVVHFSNVVLVDGWARFTVGGGFLFGWLFPVVSFQEASNVGCGREFYVVPCLKYIMSIVFTEQTLIDEWDILFCGHLQSFSNEAIDVICLAGFLAGKSKIIDLASKKHSLPSDGALIDALLVGRVVKTDVLEYPTNVYIPEAASRGVSLEGTQDGNNKGSVESDAGVSPVPLNESVIDSNEGGSAGTWRVSKGITCITTDHNQVLGGGESKEEPKHRLFNAC